MNQESKQRTNQKYKEITKIISTSTTHYNPI